MPIVLDARTATDHFPGIGRYVVHLARGLAQIIGDTPVNLLHDSAARAGRLTLPQLPPVVCSASPFSLRQQWAVPQALRRAGATLYHSPYYLMPYRPGVPTVLTCYDVIPLVLPAYFSARQRLFFRLAHGLALRASSVVLVISSTTRDDLVRCFGMEPGKVIVTPLAADEHFRPQSPEEVARVRHLYGLPDEYVLYVGSNKPHKNLVRLVQAWAAVESATANACLVIAGHWDARYPEALQSAEKAGLADRILFVGAVADADLAALYSGARCFVFPSLYEGFGLPVLEAMACGTPVACSNVSSLPEVVGDATLLFDPLEVDSMADALARLLAGADLRAEMDERGLQRAACFSWERTTRQTLEAYRSCGYVG